ncbi:hypothetical protein RPE49_25735, partial [Enterobacter hormaechei subsp. xiangfangensis]|uniref:hypothetical protein n=1 Tax=Enterobacter hormaechei TaxID=158836 RepID=UPI0039BFADC2
MGSCAAPSAKGDDKFITTDYLQQCRLLIPRFYVSTSKSIIKALINMHSFEIQLSAFQVGPPR